MSNNVETTTEFNRNIAENVKLRHAAKEIAAAPPFPLPLAMKMKRKRKTPPKEMKLKKLKARLAEVDEQLDKLIINKPRALVQLPTVEIILQKTVPMVQEECITMLAHQVQGGSPLRNISMLVHQSSNSFPELLTTRSTHQTLSGGLVQLNTSNVSHRSNLFASNPPHTNLASHVSHTTTPLDLMTTTSITSHTAPTTFPFINPSNLSMTSHQPTKLNQPTAKIIQATEPMKTVIEEQPVLELYLQEEDLDEAEASELQEVPAGPNEKKVRGKAKKGKGRPKKLADKEEVIF